MENENAEEVELTPEEKARRTEEFFAKKRAQNAGEEAVPGAEQMGSVAAAGAMGAIEGAVTGAAKGAGKAVKAGVGALAVDPLIGAAKLVGTPVRLLGWDGIHRMAEEAEKSWSNWGADALDHGYEDWGTTLGDVGAKITGIAGMMGSFYVPGAAAAKLTGIAGKAAKVYNAALPFIFGNTAAVDTYDRAKASGQSTGRALAEAAADGAINFFGFKLFANKSLNRLLKIPEMQEPYAQRFVNEGIEKGVHGFGNLVKMVRNGSLSEILLSRAKGALKAGGIMGLQNGLSSLAKQYADEDVRPVEEWSDEEIIAAKAKIDAWEAEKEAAEAEGRAPNTDMKPEWEKDLWDRLAAAAKAGLHGVAEGATLEGVMGAGETALTLREAREVTAGAIRKLIETPKGRAFINKQNPDALGVVAGVAREGGTPTKEQLDAAGLPPEMPMREVRRLAFDLKRDVEMADARREMETEDYRKRAELAERVIAEQEDGKPLEFETEEQKAEVELALHERQERREEARADAMVDAAQGMADTLFGKEAGVLVRRGTAEEQERGIKAALGEDADAKQLKDAEGTVQGWWNRKTGEVVLFRGADETTVAHELLWHATRTWAERNAPELLAKMQRYAEECPAELRAEIEKLYPDFKGDDLLDEIGAARFEKELGDKFTELLERSPEAKSWWQGLKDMIAEAWRGMVRSLKVGKFESLKVEEGEIDLKALEAMTPEKGMEWLVGQMAEGRRLGDGEAAKNAKGAERQSGEVRYSRKLKPEIVEQVTADEKKATRRGAEEALKALAKKPLVNLQTGIEAQINAVQRNKILSNAATNKSINNGYTRQEHNAAAAIIERLWRHAEQIETRPDRSGDRNIKTIGRFIAPVIFTERDANAYITVKETRIAGHRIYSLELEKLEAPGKNPDASTPTLKGQDGLSSGAAGDTSKKLGTGEPPANSEDGANYSTGGEAAQEGSDIRPKIKGIYTGSAADYANRSREGGKEDGPSLKHIGTGEGSQVYGWGLYGSSEKGVAEAYAKHGRGAGGKDWTKEGKNPQELTEVEKAAASYMKGMGSKAAAMERLKEDMAYWENKNNETEAGYIGKIIDEIKEHGDEYREQNENVYEQTWFTNRAEGDESHLLKWYEPVSEEQLKWIKDALVKEKNIRDYSKTGYGNVLVALEHYLNVYSLEGDTRGITGETVYKAIENVVDKDQKAASEFLYRAGIDGIKYPVDSYGAKTVKDGDKAGWNYVAFSDEHIRVDHKWTDGQIRYSRKLKPTEVEEREREERALKAVREGRVRVADSGDEAGEASEPGAAAAAEQLAAQRVAPRDDRSVSNPVSLPMSGLVGLYRALRSSPALPKVLIEAKRKGAAWVSRITKGSDVELNPEAFGIVDETDRAMIKKEMKAEGLFRNEDPVWNMKHSKRQCENERIMSEMRLEDRLNTLADDRARGKKPGGNRVATNALAHEIGRLIMAMPMSERLRTAAGKEGVKTLKDLRTIGEGIVKTLESEWKKALKEGVKEKGGAEWDAELDVTGHLRDAVEAVAWWRGIGMTAEEMARYEAAAKDGTLPAEEIARLNGELETRLTEEGRAKAALAKDQKELAGELFGMFLAAPETLRERAPRAFNRIVEAISGNETLAKAYARIANADAPTEVMAKIREQWTHEAQIELRNLEKEIDAPLGTWVQRVKRRTILNLHSKEGPVVSIIDDALKERVAAAKQAVKLAKRGGDEERIAHAEAQLQAVRKDAHSQIIDLKMGILKKQRGGGMEREYALNVTNRVMGDIARDGVALKDLRTYMKAKWCIALQGRADSFGMSPQEANKVIEGLKARLGDADFARLESAQRRFGEERRKAILDNPDVVAAFGPALVEAWKKNADYVRSERILSAQQVKEYKAVRDEWLKKNPGQADVLGDIELMVEMHRVRHGGSDGSVFAKPLEGSFKATGDPLAYTLMHDMHILQFARRNALVMQIADVAAELKVEGFKEVSDANLGRALEGSRRYGSVAFMRGGERKLLIMPKVAAEGFKAMGEGDVAGLVKANRMVSAVLTQYSLRFAWRNMFRNRQAVENNIPWMRESRLQTASRYFGLGPVAKLAEHLMERAVVRLPDSVVRNWAANLVWGENTTMYWMGEATRIAKLMFDPKAIRNLAERADAAAADGDLAAAQAIMEDIAKARDMMKKPIFAGQWRMMTGQADRADLDAVFAALDMRTNFEGEKYSGLRRAARDAKDLADTVRRFNTFEEARIKIVAELAAERARNNAAAEGEEFRYSQKEVDYLTATMAGSPRYEMRGRWMNVLEAIPFGPFANVGMKGAWRTVESMKTDPKAWWGKAAHRIAGRMAEIALWGAGGYALVAAIARRMFGDNEEAQKAIDGFESFGKRMARARACISDYRLRNYDIVPLGLYGEWCSFGINMPRGDEDRLIMPLTDTVARYLMKGDAATRAGLHDPIDGAYKPWEAAISTVTDSGLAPDIYRGSMIWNLGKDTLYAWLQNPYNTFTKRNTYGQAVWENRFGSWSGAKDFFVETMKQAWNDVGGQVVVPATTWDEDAGDVPDEGKWVLGMAEPKDAAEMPVGGKTIFRALHYAPMASSMLSGMFYMNCDGDARIARRLEKMQAHEKAARDHVAMHCVKMMLDVKNTSADYANVLDAAIAENGWDSRDRALIEQAITLKVKAAARKLGRENVPILEVFNKINQSDRERNEMERYLTGIGFEVQ